MVIKQHPYNLDYTRTLLVPSNRGIWSQIKGI